MGKVVSVEEKYMVAKRYQDILEVINLFGDGIMLQDQLQQILIIIGRYSRNNSVVDALKVLEEKEIIKKVQQKKYRSQFILFKKFAIRFLEGKQNSQQVTAIKRVSLEKYDRIVFKTEVFIVRYLKEKTTLEEVLKRIDREESSILFNKEQAYHYMQVHIDKYQDNKNYTDEHKLLEELRKQAIYNLNQKQDKKDISMSNIDEKSSLQRLFRKGAFVLTVKSTREISFGYICRSANVKSLAEVYRICVLVAAEVYGIEENNISIFILCKNKGLTLFIADAIQVRHFNNVTKEMSKYTKLQQELIKLKVSTSAAEDIGVSKLKVKTIDVDKYLNSDF